MISNCVKFNPPKHQVHQAALGLAAHYDSMVQDVDWAASGIALKRRKSASARKSRNDSDSEEIAPTSTKRRLSAYPALKTLDNPPKHKIAKIPVGAPGICENCHGRDTPMWRQGPSGKSTLCNKCGVKWKSGKLLVHDILGTPFTQPTADQVLQPKSRPHPITTSNVEREKVLKKVCSALQKQQLATILSDAGLDPQHLGHIVNMIRLASPSLLCTDGVKPEEENEVELDIEMLDDALVWDMYRYACGISK